MLIIYIFVNSSLLRVAGAMLQCVKSIGFASCLLDMDYNSNESGQHT